MFYVQDYFDLRKMKPQNIISSSSIFFHIEDSESTSYLESYYDKIYYFIIERVNGLADSLPVVFKELVLEEAG